MLLPHADLPLPWLLRLITSGGPDYLRTYLRHRLLRTCRFLAKMVMALAPKRQLRVVIINSDGTDECSWPGAALAPLLQQWAPPSLDLQCFGRAGYSDELVLAGPELAAFPPPPELALHQWVTRLQLDGFSGDLILSPAVLRQLQQWERLRELVLNDVVLGEGPGLEEASEEEEALELAPPQPPIPQLRKLAITREFVSMDFSAPLQRLLGDLAARATELRLRSTNGPTDVSVLVQQMPALQRICAHGITSSTMVAITQHPAVEHVELGSVDVFGDDEAPAPIPRPPGAAPWRTLVLAPECSLPNLAHTLPLAAAAESIVLPEDSGVLLWAGKDGPDNATGVAALEQLGGRLTVRPWLDEVDPQRHMTRGVSASLGLSCFRLGVIMGKGAPEVMEEDFQEEAARMLRLVLRKRPTLEALHLYFDVEEGPARGYGLGLVEKLAGVLQEHQQRLQAGFRLHTLVVSEHEDGAQPLEEFWRGLTRSLPPCITRLVVVEGGDSWAERTVYLSRLQAVVEAAPPHPLLLTVLGSDPQGVWGQLQQACADRAPALTLERLPPVDDDVEEEEEEEEEEEQSQD